MTAPDDDFEKLLAEALDPGEIELSSSQRGELLAVFAAVEQSPAADGRAELEKFTALLAEALDPGEIAFEDAQRRELIRRMTGAAAGDNLTAWALGEMPLAEREQLERRMEVNVSLREEALSYRRLCSRLTDALPAIARPGWRERARLRHVVFGSPRRGVWIAAAAAVALLLAILPTRQDAGAPAVVRREIPAVPHAGPPAPVTTAAVAPEPAVAVAGPVPVVPPAPLPPSLRPDLLPLELPAAAIEPAFAFVGPVSPSPPGIPAASRFAGFPEVAAGVAFDRASEEGGISPGSNLLLENGGAPGEMMLAANDPVFGAGGGNDTGMLPGGSIPIARPEPGSLSLAHLQPYVLPGLLGGAASGRPAISEGQGNRTVSADFRLLDLGLSSGAGLDAESWSASAGMTWQLAPEWQAGLSIGGIDSRLDVPDFGDVDVTGAAFGGSLDWRKDGYHAALSYEIGVFDQDLRRKSPGVLQPSDQDATVHRLSFWCTREFGAGPWKHGPVVGFDGSLGRVDAYQEPFAGGVTMEGRDFRALTTLVGWQAWGRYDTPAGTLFPNLVAGWRHRPVVPDETTYQSWVGQDFAVPAQVPERDSLLLEGGFRWLPGDGPVFLDFTTSGEWREGGESENRVLLEVGVSF